MITENISILLIIFGSITSLMFLQLLFPRYYARTSNKISHLDGTAVFFAREAGVAITSIGALLIWAGLDPSIRFPIVLVATIGKLIFVITILSNFKEFPGLLMTAIIDILAVVVFTLYLLGL